MTFVTEAGQSNPTAAQGGPAPHPTNLNGDPVTKDLKRPIKPKRCARPNQSLGHAAVPELLMLSLQQGRGCTASGWRMELRGPQGPYPHRAQDNCGGTTSVSPQAMDRGSLKGCWWWGWCPSMGTGACRRLPGLSHRNRRLLAQEINPRQLL